MLEFVAIRILSILQSDKGRQGSFLAKEDKVLYSQKLVNPQKKEEPRGEVCKEYPLILD